MKWVYGTRRNKNETISGRKVSFLGIKTVFV